jgi:hypothetical protein
VNNTGGIMAFPTLTNNSENWTINRNDWWKIEAAKMEFLISVARCTLIYQKCSTYIRAELNIHLGSKVEHRKRDWYENILRTKHSRLPDALLQYKPAGHRSVGRPKIRWIDGFSWCRNTTRKPDPCRRCRRC